jgi:hypothetical protein
MTNRSVARIPRLLHRRILAAFVVGQGVVSTAWLTLALAGIFYAWFVWIFCALGWLIALALALSRRRQIWRRLGAIRDKSLALLQNASWYFALAGALLAMAAWAVGWVPLGVAVVVLAIQGGVRRSLRERVLETDRIVAGGRSDVSETIGLDCTIRPDGSAICAKSVARPSAGTRASKSSCGKSWRARFRARRATGNANVPTPEKASTMSSRPLRGR